jgi:hypothetical protein
VTIAPLASPLPALGPNFLGLNYNDKAPLMNQSWPQSKASQALAYTSVGTLRFPGGDPAQYFDWHCPFADPSSAKTPCPSTPTATSRFETDPGSVLNASYDLWSVFIANIKRPSLKVLYQTNVYGDSGLTPPGNGDPFNVTPISGNPPVSSPAEAQGWAQHNVDDNLPSLWEIGNEPDVTLESANNLKFDDPKWGYTPRFHAQAQAIHSVDPSLLVFGPAIAHPGFPTAKSDGDIGTFLSLLATTDGGASDLDVLSVHYYTGVCDLKDATWTALTAEAPNWATNHGAWLHRAAKNGGWTGPIAMTEFAIGPQQCTTTQSNYVERPAFNPSIGNALVNLDMIGAFAADGLSYAYYFDLHNGNTGQYADGLFFGQGECSAANSCPAGRVQDSPVPLYYAFAMWAAMGETVMSCTLPSTLPATSFGCWAAKKAAKGSVQVLLINKQGSPQALDISGYAAGATKAMQYLLEPAPPAGQAPDWLDIDVLYNGQQDPQLDANYSVALPAPQALPVSGGTFAVTVPAYSAVVLDFQ